MDIKEVGRFIYDKRKEFGYSKEDISGHAKISPTTLYKIEHIKSSPKYETVEKILNLFGYELKIVKKESKC